MACISFSSRDFILKHRLKSHFIACHRKHEQGGSLLGQTIFRFVDRFLAFFGGLFLLLLRVIYYLIKGRANVGLTIAQMSILGTASIPIVCLVLSFVGASITFIIAEEMAARGFKTFVGGLVLLVLLREMIPVLTGVVLAGKVGASITSEIGAMKISEQIDALKALSTDPDWFLTIPRVLGLVIMSPVVAIFAGYAGFYAGFLMAYEQVNMNYITFIAEIPTFVEMSDYRACFIKTIIFGAVVALVACYHGFSVERGAAGVGKAVTNSVTNSIVLIFGLDLILMPILF